MNSNPGHFSRGCRIYFCIVFAETSTLVLCMFLYRH